MPAFKKRTEVSRIFRLLRRLHTTPPLQNIFFYQPSNVLWLTMLISDEMVEIVTFSFPFRRTKRQIGGNNLTRSMKVADVARDANIEILILKLYYVIDGECVE